MPKGEIYDIFTGQQIDHAGKGDYPTSQRVGPVVTETSLSLIETPTDSRDQLIAEAILAHTALAQAKIEACFPSSDISPEEIRILENLTSEAIGKLHPDELQYAREQAQIMLGDELESDQINDKEKP